MPKPKSSKPMSSLRKNKNLKDLISKNDWEEVMKVIKSKPNLAKRKEDGWLPLHLACCEKRIPFKVISCLLKAYPDGIKEKTAFYGYSPLHIVVNPNNEMPYRVFNLLIETCPELASQLDSFGCLPLHMAVKSPKASSTVVKRLLKLHPEGSKVKGSQKEIPLHLAARGGVQNGVIHALVSSFPEGLQELNMKKCTPLELARNYDRHNTVRFLERLEQKYIAAEAPSPLPSNDNKRNVKESKILEQNLAASTVFAELAETSSSPSPSEEMKSNNSMNDIEHEENDIDDEPIFIKTEDRSIDALTAETVQINDGDENYFTIDSSDIGTDNFNISDDIPSQVPSGVEYSNIVTPNRSVSVKRERSKCSSIASIEILNKPAKRQQQQPFTLSFGSKIPKVMQPIEDQERILGIESSANGNLKERLVSLEIQIFGSAQSGAASERIQNLMYKDRYERTTTWFEWIEQTEKVFGLTTVSENVQNQKNALERLEEIEQFFFGEVKNGGIIPRLEALYDHEL